LNPDLHSLKQHFAVILPKTRLILR